jgi:hypothetical protein
MGAQAGVQIINALTGFLLIRLLPRDSAYAWFTITNSALLMIQLLSDPGTTSAVHSLAGPLWNQPQRVGQIVRALRQQLVWIVAGSALIGIPFTSYLLWKAQAPAGIISLACLFLALGAWPGAFSHVLAHLNRLQLRYRQQFSAELGASLLRLATTAALVVLPLKAFPHQPTSTFFGAIAGILVSQWLYLRLLRPALPTGPDIPATEQRSDRTAIQTILVGAVPLTVYYLLQSHLSTWLITLYGKAPDVADVGALSRLVTLFGIASAPLVQIAAPSFARCSDPDTLRGQLLKACAAYALFAISAVVVTLLFPSAFLLLLGSDYAHLTSELVVAILALVSTTYAGVLWGLVLARGWVKSSAWIIPFGLLGQIIGIASFELSSVAGVLWFNATTAVPGSAVALWIIFRSLSQWPSTSPS